MTRCFNEKSQTQFRAIFDYAAQLPFPSNLCSAHVPALISRKFSNSIVRQIKKNMTFLLKTIDKDKFAIKKFI